MDDFLDFFNSSKAQRQIDKLAKKYKGKKIMLYGAGLYALTLIKNHDLSKLNVLGIADKRFATDNSEGVFAGLKTFAPDELFELDLDAIFLSVQEFNLLKDIIVNTIAKKHKNKNIKVLPIIKKSFWHNIIEIIED